MSTSSQLKPLTTRRLGKLPVVVLPLSDYERMREDLEMLRSRSLARRIKQARQEAKGGKTLSLEQLKKRYKLR